MAQATASLYGVKTYPEQLALKEKTLRDELFLTLPGAIRLLVQQLALFGNPSFSRLKFLVKQCCMFCGFLAGKEGGSG